MSLDLLSALFLLLVGTMAGVVLTLFSRYLSGNSRIVAIGVFIPWLLYAGILGYLGVIGLRKPPGPAFLLIPVTLFVAIFMVRHPTVRTFAERIPVPLLIGLQSFRLFVEVALFLLYQKRLIPQIFTFERGNLDILIGLSAPVMAWLVAKGRVNEASVRVWCWIGIALLANIVGRVLMVFFGLLQTEIPNRGLGIFPFTFLPGFLAPLALCLHILLLRSLPRKKEPRGSIIR